MRDLVRDDVAADLGRGEDQPPAQPDSALRRAASPARAGIADADRAARDPGRGREFGDFARHGRERAAASGTSRFAGQALRGPPQRNSSSSRCGVRGHSSDQDQHRSRPSIGIMAPGANGSPGSARAELRLDPFALVERPAQRRPPARPHGQVSFSTPLASSKRSRNRRALAIDGPRSAPAAPLPGPRQSGRSTTCHSSSPASCSLTVQPRVDCPAS